MGITAIPVNEYGYSTFNAQIRVNNDKGNIMYKNKNVFKNLEDPETLYWLGFIATDGCIVPNHNKEPAYMAVEIKSTDSYHLFRLRNYFQGNARIVNIKRTTKTGGVVKTSRYRVGGKNCFIPRLIRLGITPRKSFTLKIHKTLAKSRDFWRGALDGDGHIGFLTRKYTRKDGNKIVYKYPKINLASASEDFALQFKEFVDELFGYEVVRVKFFKSAGIYHANINKTDEVIMLLRHLYYFDCLCLDRKLESYQQLLAQYRKDDNIDYIEYVSSN